jgi:hypothetical protein
MKLILVSKRIKYILKKMKTAVCWTSRLNNSNVTCSTIIESIDEKHDKSIDELTTNFKIFGIIIHIERVEEYDKKSSKAMMMNFLSDEDNMAPQDCYITWKM